MALLLLLALSSIKHNARARQEFSTTGMPVVTPTQSACCKYVAAFFHLLFPVASKSVTAEIEGL
jgi:hypothetical protein